MNGAHQAIARFWGGLTQKAQENNTMDSNSTKPLFLIGNKRSGTSHLVRLLNLHPQVFVTHESDAVWILYQTSARTRFTR